MRENAFDHNKMKPGLNLTPGQALIGLRTSGPWFTQFPNPTSESCSAFCGHSASPKIQSYIALQATKAADKSERKQQPVFSTHVLAQVSLSLYDMVLQYSYSQLREERGRQDDVYKHPCKSCMGSPCQLLSSEGVFNHRAFTFNYSSLHFAGRYTRSMWFKTTSTGQIMTTYLKT